MFDTIDIASQGTTANILAGTLNLPFPLEGLTEEQIAAVTAPLEFEPFPMSDDEEEN
jgi:hypothetical protein